MKTLLYIRDRLNWIDWAKAFAISFVVFGHIPEKTGSFLVCYITQFHMPFFFFISGFLNKTTYLNKDTLNKYWHSLIIPYLCYNILFYPYWVIRHIIELSDTLQWYDFIKPLIGTVMLQHTSPYFEPLNGVTWFISALLIMRILLSTIYNYKIAHVFVFLGIFICAVVFIINEFERYIIDLPFVGFIRCFPFFILGFICKKYHIISEGTNMTRDIIISFIGIGASIYTFFIGFNGIVSYGIYFWTINISAIGGIIGICKLLNHVKSEIIQNISIGTITIMGFHWIFIGTINYSLEKMMHLKIGIIYPWYLAIIITLIIIGMIYPIIILFKNKYTFMLGKRSTIKQDKDS